jgi:predicted dehydrogenase
MLTAAVVGVGTPPEQRGPGQYGQGYRHAWGYHRAAGVRLVGCADRDAERGRRFATTFGLDDGQVYADHSTLLGEHAPDIVSVCTPPGSHQSIVADCVTADVTAIHCEKPLAPTLGACRAMVDTCNAADVTLTVNHQRRFAFPFRNAKALLDAGEIGSLKRVGFHGKNLFDYGIHLFDLSGYVTDHDPVAWVDATLTYETEQRRYGLHNENCALAHWRYESGVDGVALSGTPSPPCPRFELVGADGRIQIEPPGGPVLRVGTPGDWRRVRTWGDTVDGIDSGSLRGIARRIARNLPGTRFRRLAPASYTERGIVALVRSVRTGSPLALAAEHSLAATELVFACYASARRGERVSLPLAIDYNPLERMVDEGALNPSPAA